MALMITPNADISQVKNVLIMNPSLRNFWSRPVDTPVLADGSHIGNLSTVWRAGANVNLLRFEVDQIRMNRQFAVRQGVSGILVGAPPLPGIACQMRARWSGRSWGVGGNRGQ